MWHTLLLMVIFLSDFYLYNRLFSVPSAPPRDITLQMLGNNTLRLSWAPPATEHHNGPLHGYKIFLHGNETKFSRNITTNSSVHSVVISHLVSTISYGVQMAAFNRIGVGVRSRGQSTGQYNYIMLNGL